MALISLSAFRPIISGDARGFGPAVARGVLAAAEWPYRAAAAWRNRRYDRGAASIHRAGVCVISVGNLTLGGTGKTPMIEWLARWYRRRSLRVSIVSRGYKPTDGSRNDEALELELRLPDVPHLQNADRVAAARTAVEELDAQLILLDDGFQHRRLHRDLDLVLLDALEPFGYGHVFPRGLLRESPAGLRRAHVVGLSRADQATPEDRAAVGREVRRLAPHAIWIELAHAPLAWTSSDCTDQPPGWLSGKRVTAFSGIGNPQGFTRTLERLNVEVASFVEFPDHHRYDKKDVDGLARRAREDRAEAVVCTEKDLVKLRVPRLGECPLQALRIGVEVLEGAPELEAALERVCPSGRSEQAD